MRYTFCSTQSIFSLIFALIFAEIRNDVVSLTFNVAAFNLSLPVFNMRDLHNCQCILFSLNTSKLFSLYVKLNFSVLSKHQYTVPYSWELWGDKTFTESKLIAFCEIFLGNLSPDPPAFSDAMSNWRIKFGKSVVNCQIHLSFPPVLSKYGGIKIAEFVSNAYSALL